jgi:hypothetical protein
MKLIKNLKIKISRIEPQIPSNIELNGIIKKKNQIHKKIWNKNKNQEIKDQIYI